MKGKMPRIILQTPLSGTSTTISIPDSMHQQQLRKLLMLCDEGRQCCFLMVTWNHHSANQL
jgi:hypothetical protein